MVNLLTSEQMRLADAYTIQNRPVSSIDLMESASQAFVVAFMEEVPVKETRLAVLCGKGNNGGDGLAIARILLSKGYSEITVYLVNFSEKESPEYQVNLKRLKGLRLQQVVVTKARQFKELTAEVIIDAVLGSGLNKALKGAYLEMAEVINALERKVIAVDVPTGFPAEGKLDPEQVCLNAALAISFQQPKINFFFPESAVALKRFRVVDIGLDAHFISTQHSGFQLTDQAAISGIYRPRELFSHKGTYGHALLIAGREKTMGAALLAARACLSGGAGLTTLSIPPEGLTALNTALPEVMYLGREKLKETDYSKFKSIAVGPGLGTDAGSIKLVSALLHQGNPLVLDADALNILSLKKELLELLPAGSILTPHMKEFDHLFGAHTSWWERLETARVKAKQFKCTIVLKNQYTFIVDNSGDVTVNPTGNPAMAQGGMGDVLTGLIAAFTAQGYAAREAAILACYLHGRAGDELAITHTNVTASAVAIQVPASLKGLIK